jgi:O-acetyl-ADP-ribose deacetylase (regulator of RNase III)
MSSLFDVRPNLQVVHGDITLEEVDIVVNAANGALSGGGGVDGAIHRAAGPELQDACRKLGRCPPGSAVITGGFRLHARHIIHVVGPVWTGGSNHEDQTLASCFNSALDLARAADARSLAFPAISCGAYKFPPSRAARIAVEALNSRDWSNNTIRLVRFVCFDLTTFRAFEKEIASAKRAGWS